MDNIRAGKEASVFFYLCNRMPERWRHVNRIIYEGEMTLTHVDGNELLQKLRAAAKTHDPDAGNNADSPEAES